MLKSTTPSAKKVGSGCYLIQENKGEKSAGEKSKPVPNNQGKKYFSWGMKERNMLLRECAHAQVWNFPPRNKATKWANIPIILKSVPDFKSTLANLEWRKCQEEFNRNVQLFQAEGESYRFKSGDDEEHTEWHDIMEDIKSRMLLDETQLTDVAQAVEKRVLEDDLNVAGVLLRDKEACRSKSKANK